MNDNEKEQLRELLESIYSEQLVSNWDMNQKVYQVLIDMMTASSQCNRAMDLVPRPAAVGGNPATWMAKESAKALLRHFNAEENKHYLVCLKATAAKYRSKFEMARLGL